MKVIATYIVDTWQGLSELYKTEEGEWYLRGTQENDRGFFVATSIRKIDDQDAQNYIESTLHAKSLKK